jgi:hypothetical protein
MTTVLGGLVDEWTWYVLCSSYSAGPHRYTLHISLPLQVMFTVTALLLASTYHGDFGIMIIIHGLISLGVVGYFDRLILNCSSDSMGYFCGAQAIQHAAPSTAFLNPSSMFAFHLLRNRLFHHRKEHQNIDLPAILWHPNLRIRPHMMKGLNPTHRPYPTPYPVLSKSSFILTLIYLWVECGVLDVGWVLQDPGRDVHAAILGRVDLWTILAARFPHHCKRTTWYVL